MGKLLFSKNKKYVLIKWKDFKGLRTNHINIYKERNS